MSKDAAIAVVGTVAGTAWAVFAALSMDVPILRYGLATVSILVPLTLWGIASRLRARGSPRADTMVLWALPASMVMVFIVDLVAWLR
jgi:hypothetical protein